MNTRRQFIKATSAGLIGATCFGVRADAPALEIIDAHVHFYDPTRAEGVPWPAKNDRLLYRRVMPEDFLKVASPLGVRRAIVVEASTWVTDNQWILDLAKREPSIVGLVGNLDSAGEGYERDLEPLTKDPLFRGIRLRADAGGGQVSRGLSDERFKRRIKLLADNDLELDVGSWAASLPEITKLAELIPDLRIVINHIAGVKVDGKSPAAEWIAELEAVAKHRNVYCKISGLGTATGLRDGKAPTDPGYYKPTIDVFWNAFGEDRLIYGSDWPVCEYAASYATVFDIVHFYFRDKGPAAMAKFFKRNAKAAYKWVLTG